MELWWGGPCRQAGPELEAAWAWGAAEGRMWPGAPGEAGLNLDAEGTSASQAEVSSDPLWGCLSPWLVMVKVVTNRAQSAPPRWVPKCAGSRRGRGLTRGPLRSAPGQGSSRKAEAGWREEVASGCWGVAAQRWGSGCACPPNRKGGSSDLGAVFGTMDASGVGNGYPVCVEEAAAGGHPGERVAAWAGVRAGWGQLVQASEE